MNQLGELTDPEEAARQAQMRALRPRLNIGGWLGIGLLLTAGWLVWRKR
jgi:hypothetical protein